jgi:hypothetical protein
MLALLIFIVICLTAHGLFTTKVTPEELNEMLNSDEWY